MTDTYERLVRAEQQAHGDATHYLLGLVLAALDEPLDADSRADLQAAVRVVIDRSGGGQ